MAHTPSADGNDWTQLLDRLSKENEGQLVTIELLDPTFGDQYEAERMPFAYATYDPKDDMIIVAVGGRSARFPVVLRHMISHPTEVGAAEFEGAGSAIRVIDADGTVTLVSFFPATTPL